MQILSIIAPLQMSMSNFIKYPCFLKMQLKNYQRRIATNIKEKNSLVILPTGTGKTLIGAQVILEAIDKTEKRAVFLEVS